MLRCNKADPNADTPITEQYSDFLDPLYESAERLLRGGVYRFVSLHQWNFERQRWDQIGQATPANLAGL